MLREPGERLRRRGLATGNADRQRSDTLAADLVDARRQQRDVEASSRASRATTVSPALPAHRDADARPARPGPAFLHDRLASETGTDCRQ